MRKYVFQFFPNYMHAGGNLSIREIYANKDKFPELLPHIMFGCSKCQLDLLTALWPGVDPKVISEATMYVPFSVLLDPATEYSQETMERFIKHNTGESA